MRNSGQKNVLTTGEVARICNVAPRTVSKWFDAGHLPGYRIPGSKDRRIPIDQLMRFMRAHGIPLNGLDRAGTRVLLLDADASLCGAVKSALDQVDGYEVETAGTALEAGALVQATDPDVILADVSLPDLSPKTLVRFFRARPRRSDVLLIGTGHGLTDAQGQALLQEGFDAYVAKPFEVRTLLRLIEPVSCPDETTPSLTHRA